MKYNLYILVLFFSFESLAQSETDSVFYFDRTFNYTTLEDCKWISKPEKLDDSTVVVRTKYNSTSEFLQKGITDKYQIHKENKITIVRSFSDDNFVLPGEYEVHVDIINSDDGIYELKIFSRELNLNRTVFSKTLIPICPIIKTIDYHPNDTVAEIKHLDKSGDSLWTSTGRLIDDLYYDFNVDSLPVFLNYRDESFIVSIKKLIRDFVTYPQDAIKADIMGSVYVTCIITSEGKVEHIQVAIGVHPLIDNPSLNVLRQLQIFRPAIKDDKPVDFRLMFPITFSIE